MFSGGLFSVGLAGPLLVLFLSFLAIGIPFSVAAIAVRLRTALKTPTGNGQRKIDWGIAVLAISGVMPILGGVLSHYGLFRIGMIVAGVGIVFLWPVSAVLAVRGNGAGRGALLVAHGLLALLSGLLFLSVLIHFA